MSQLFLLSGEARLLARQGETPTHTEQPPEQPIDITKDLRTLESTVYEQLKASTKEKSVTVPYGATVECDDGNGRVSRLQHQNGFLIKKGEHGFLLVANGGLQFVPNDNFHGRITSVEGNRRTVLREARVSPSNSAPAPTVDSTQSPAAETPPPVVEQAPTAPGSRIVQLSAQNMGVRTEGGTALTFRPNETGVIQNSLGKLQRTGNSLRVTYTPAPNLRDKVYVGNQLVYDPSTSTQTPSPATDTPPDRSTRAPRPSAEPERPVDDVKEKVTTALQMVSGPEAYKIPAEVRHFVKFYNDVWQTYDRQGTIGRRVLMSNEYAQLERYVERNDFSASAPRGITELAKKATRELALALVGPENTSTEFNEYYNRFQRAATRTSPSSAAYQLYDVRYARNPNGRYSEKEGRVPQYRSPRTEQLVKLQERKESLYFLIGKAGNDTVAKGFVEEYRRAEHTYNVVSHALREEYEAQWTDRELTDTSRRPPNGTTQRDIARAYFNRHNAIDTLMLPEKRPEQILTNQAERKKAEDYLRQFTAPYPAGY